MAMPAASGAAQPVRIEFWTISLQPFFTDYINGLIDTYGQTNPGVKVHWIDVQFQAIEQKLLAAIAGGVAPDVVNLNVEFTTRIAEKGALANLEPLVPANTRVKYFEGFWTSAQFRGRSYGLPWYVAPAVIVYNVDLFKRAGLNPQAPPANEEGMIAAARQLKDRGHVYGFMPLVDGVSILYRYLEQGLPILSANGKRAVFNSPAHVAYLQRYVELFQKDYFPEDTLRRGFLGAVERYSAGQLGMLIVGPQFLLRVKASNPEIYAQSAVAPYPLGKGRVIHTPLMVLTVPKASQHHREAANFALYVTNDANQLAFSKRVVIFPSTKAAAADAFFKTPGKGPESLARRIAADELKFGRDLTVVISNEGELFKIFREAIERAFFGKMAPREALDWAVREWNARL